jgi:DNA-binding MarR family transcriptional regulator
MPTLSTSVSKKRQATVNYLTQEIGRGLATKTVLFHAALAAKLGLSATELKCLDLLRHAEGSMTATDLVDRTGLSGGAITGVIDRLEESGFVERVRDTEDRRRWKIRPIPGSRQQVLDLFAPLRGTMATLFARYSDSELDMIAEFLVNLGRALDSEADRLRE